MADAKACALALLLAACGGASTTQPGEPPQRGADVEQGNADSSDAGSDASPPIDAPPSNVAADPGNPELDRCRAAACQNAACGTAPAQCNGLPVDCGTCPGAQDRCGDDVPNQCSHVCFVDDAATHVCQHWQESGPGQLSFNPKWAVTLACHTAPYGGYGNTLEPRAGGLTGCVMKSWSGNNAWCCP